MFILFPSFLIVALHGMALPTKAVSLFKGQESHGQGLLMLVPSTWSSDGCFYLHLSSADMAATIKNGKNSPRLIQVTLACLNELRLCSFNGMLLHQNAFSVLQTHLGDVFVILNHVLVKQDRKLSGSRLVKSFVGTESLKKVEQSLADLKSKTSPFFKVKWTLSFTTRFKRNPGLINSHGVSIGVLYWLYQIHLLSNIWADFPTLGYASDFGSYKLIPNQIGTLTIDSRPSFSKKKHGSELNAFPPCGVASKVCPCWEREPLFKTKPATRRPGQDFTMLIQPAFPCPWQIPPIFFDPKMKTSSFQSLRRF